MMTEEQAEQLQGFPKLTEHLTALQEALQDAGIELPGLHLDPSSFTDGGTIPLYVLGRCNRRNAQRLIEVLRKGAS